MRTSTRPLSDMLPLTALEYDILLSLFKASRHGYEMLRHLRTGTRRNISTATLYRQIDYLEADGIIEVDEEQTAMSDDQRRRYYKMTSFGYWVFTAETNRLFVKAGMGKRLLGETDSPFEGK
jgi:hypothetical protein